MELQTLLLQNQHLLADPHLLPRLLSVVAATISLFETFSER